MKSKLLNRTGIYIAIAIASLFLVFVICKNIYYLQEEIATQKAIQACDCGLGLCPVEPPSEPEIHLGFDKTYNLGSDPHVVTRLAWIVDIKGKWVLVAGPPPEPDDLSKAYVDRCVIEIDVFTGKILTEPIE